MFHAAPGDDPSLPDTKAPTGVSQLQPRLTGREREVLALLPTRLSTAEIGVRLQVSPNTVKTHLKHIYRKLGARSRNEALVKALECHLLAGSSANLFDQAPLGR